MSGRSTPIGRTGGKIGKKDRKANSPPQGERWIPLTLSMIESPAWRHLSRAGRLIIDRLCAEHMAHGGHDNGRLPTTFDDFAKFGLRRNSILPAIQECEALGFIERVEIGRRAYGVVPGRASLYRLTFLGRTDRNGGGEATNEWKRIASREDAVTAVRKFCRDKSHLEMVAAE